MRKGKQHAKLNRIVIALVAVIAGFCVLSTLNDKYGLRLGPDMLELPSLTRFYNYIVGIADAVREDENRPYMDNALAVSGPVSDAPLTVHMLDVGQGDSFLILAPEKTVLIDAGENGLGPRVLRYLEEQGVKKIDLLIGTHPHSDHIGGMDTVVQGIEVDRVVLPALSDELVPTTSTYTDLLEAIAGRNLKITPAEPGMSFDLGGGAALTVMGPDAQYTDLNNMSVVTKLTYGATSFLLCGDVSAEGEQDLVLRGGLKADVLQIPHHGSNSSSTDAFLDAVSPGVALISCGLENSYDHPHRETMERLIERHMDIYRTDLMGAVVVGSDGERLYIQTQK